MARFYLFFAALVIAEVTLAATAYPSESYGFVPAPVDGHVEYLGEFAVKKYVEQKNVPLVFIQVLYAELLQRGAEHYTYRLIIKVQEGYGVKVYKAEVLQDVGKAEEPPIFNLGYFVPL